MSNEKLQEEKTVSKERAMEILAETVKPLAKEVRKNEEFNQMLDRIGVLARVEIANPLCEWIAGSKKTAKQCCPWATVFVKAGKGYWCYRTKEDSLKLAMK